MTPTIDHLSITVRYLDAAEAFYDRLLPILGFDLAHKSRGRVEVREFEAIGYMHPQLIFGINSPRATILCIREDRARSTILPFARRLQPR